MTKNIFTTSIILLLSLLSYSQNKAYKAGEIYTANQYQYGKMEFRMLAATGSGVFSNFLLLKKDQNYLQPFGKKSKLKFLQAR